MFSWFKRKREPTAAERAAKAVPGLVAAYGDLLERHPNAIPDATMLPSPKASMKTVLKMAWTADPNPKFREAIVAGYVSLGQFQDGVGITPIDCTLPKEADPARVLAILEPYPRLSGRVDAEMKSLSEEFKECTKSDGAVTYSSL